MIGHLTSATRIGSGATYAAPSGAVLMAEPEVALELGRDVEADADLDAARDAIAGLGAALELVDISDAPSDVEGIVAANVFHRAFVLGPSRPLLRPEGRGAIVVNGEERGTAALPDDFADVVRLVARLLGAVGERLQQGDRIISGSLTTPVPVSAGDAVAVDLGALGGVEGTIAA